MDYISKMTPDGRNVRVKDYKKRIKRNRRRRKIFFFSFLLLCLILFLRFAPLFKITKIECIDNAIVPSEEIITASTIGYDRNLFGTGSKKARMLIEKIPYVASAKIKKKLPGTIQIEITESRVFGFVPLNEGYIYIDENCKMLEYNTNAPDAAVPLISGTGVQSFEGGKLLQTDDEDKIKMITEAIRAAYSNFALESFTSIDVTDTGQLTIFYGYNLEAFFGSTVDIDYKTKFMLNAIANLGENPKGYINVSNPEAGANHRDVK